MVRNVLLITVDSLRFDAAESLAGSESTLSTLAVDGVWFRRAFATGPGTTSSFPAILTGTRPLSYDGLGPLLPDRPRLSEAFREADFDTGGFQCNPFLSAQFNYDRGFDTFEDYQHPLMGIATRLFPRGIELNNPALDRIDDLLHVTDGIKKAYQLVKGKPRPYVSAEVITDDTLAWLDGRDRFFCWVQYMDVHHPCYPPEAYRRQFDISEVDQTTVSEWYSKLVRNPEKLAQDELATLERLYDAAIAYTDDQIGRLIDHLRTTGQLEDTLVVFTSDHGELFGDHGQYGKPERLYDELLHVPLVVANGPAHLDDAADDLVSLLDIPPLVHDAAGIDGRTAYEGRRPGVDPVRDLVTAEHEVEGDVIVGARSKEWRYELDLIRDEKRVFDLRGSESQRVPVEQATDDPAAEQLLSRVERRLQTVNTRQDASETQLDDDIESRLEALGYR